MRLLGFLAVLLALSVVPFHGETQVVGVALALAVAAMITRTRPA